MNKTTNKDIPIVAKIFPSLLFSLLKPIYQTNTPINTISEYINKSADHFMFIKSSCTQLNPALRRV